MEVKISKNSTFMYILTCEEKEIRRIGRARVSEEKEEPQENVKFYQEIHVCHTIMQSKGIQCMECAWFELQNEHIT